MNIVFVRKNLIMKPGDLKKRAFESAIARIVAKFGAKYFYNVENPIVIEDKKPRFDTKDLYFSISHSNNIVAVALDNFDIGLDIEFMKNRNFEEISRHMHWKNIVSKQDFYQAWTCYEANIKQKSSNIQSFLFESYALSVASASNKNIKSSINLYELKINESGLSSVDVCNHQISLENLKAMIFDVKKIESCELQCLPPLDFLINVAF